jgi:hypothetical protein
MSDNPNKKQDFLDGAKRQFAQISAEFEKALETLKDPARRKQLTSSYLDMLQKGLVKAQESVANYQEKVSAHTKPDQPDSTPAPEASGTPEATAAPRAESEPAQPETPPTG